MKESLNAYEPSLNSTHSKDSRSSSLRQRVNSFLNRKRSQSLSPSIDSTFSDQESSLSLTSSQTTNNTQNPFKLKLMKLKSFSSNLSSDAALKSNSTPNTSENFISSLTGSKIEVPALPSIEEKPTIFKTNSTDSLDSLDSYSQKQEAIQTIKEMNESELSESDIRLYDDIADNILKRFSDSKPNPDIIEWNI